MSLYGALSELIAGAALACAPACDLALPDKVVEDRAGLVAWISGRDEMREIRAIVEAMGREIWVGAETRGLAQRDLDQHIQAAAALVTRVRPAAALAAEIAAAARAQKPTGSTTGEAIAQRMASDIIARARAAGGLNGPDAAFRADIPLREEVIQFLLDRVFTHLTDHDRRLMRLGPALATFAGDDTAPSSKAEKNARGLAALGISRAFAAQIELAGGTAFLADLAERFGLTERCIRRLAALVDGQAAGPPSALSRLESLAQWLTDVRGQLLRPANEDAEIRRLKSAAATALAEGDFEGGMDALRLIRRELREARRRTEERLQDEAQALRGHMVEEARATARLAELLEARGEHAQAADLFAEAAMALPRADRDSAWRFNVQRAAALLKLSRERGDAHALTEALTAYASMVRQAAESTNTKALAEACLGHGEALLLAGERDPRSNRLRDAIAIYQKALQLLERERDQAGIRKARLALAHAIARHGEREGSVEALQEAAQAFRDAAACIHADKMPADYAGVQMSLGGVLLAIEEREPGKDLLVEAADAYRRAINLMDSETDGERWGEAHMNLGHALLGLGEQDGSATQLQEAIGAFKTSIEATPRVRAPRRWALTQMNLGNALAALGDRDEKGTALLDEAIAAYNMALEELLREAEPLKWAITQMNLGTALIRLGERKDRRRHWLTAAAALVPALEIFEQLGADQLADMTRRNLKRFQESWDSFLAPPGSAEANNSEPKAASPERPRLAQAG